MNNEIRDEMDLFQKVERGELSADEAATILEQLQSRSLADTAFEESVAEEVDEDISQEDPVVIEGDLRRFGKFTRWWIIPYSFGVIVTTLGALWIFLGWNGGNLTFGFWLAWIPFILGVALMALSWRARASHWLHVRVHQGEGKRPERISISLPLPFGLIKWVNRNFGHHFPPEIRGIDLDELIDEMETSITADNPIYVWVDDDKEQQQVEVWIGPGEARDK